MRTRILVGLVGIMLVSGGSKPVPASQVSSAVSSGAKGVKNPLTGRDITSISMVDNALPAYYNGNEIKDGSTVIRVPNGKFNFQHVNSDLLGKGIPFCSPYHTWWRRELF